MTDDISEVKELLQQLITNQAIHAAEQRSLKGDVEQIKHVLIEGNGQASLMVRVALAEAALERVKEERGDAKVPRAVSLGIVVSVILGLVGILAGFAN